MKTAISIPDPLFRKAEREAKRRGMTRSGFYSEALQAYLRKPNDEQITAKLNAVYAKLDSRPDPALAALAAKKLSASEW